MKEMVFGLTRLVRDEVS